MRTSLAAAYNPDGRTKAPRTFNHRGERPLLWSFHRVGLSLRGYTSFQHLPHFRCNLGELCELSVVAGIIGFDVRHINHDCAERRKFGIVAISSESLFPSGNKIRKPQCFIVVRHDDEEGFSWFAEPTHLRFEHVDIDVRRRQYDRSQLANRGLCLPKTSSAGFAVEKRIGS
jgi:hypothetical protein